MSREPAEAVRQHDTADTGVQPSTGDRGVMSFPELGEGGVAVADAAADMPRGIRVV